MKARVTGVLTSIELKSSATRGAKSGRRALSRGPGEDAKAGKWWPPHGGEVLLPRVRRGVGVERGGQCPRNGRPVFALLSARLRRDPPSNKTSCDESRATRLLLWDWNDVDFMFVCVCVCVACIFFSF